MNFFTKDPTRRQTTWGQKYDGAYWHAYVDARIEDEAVIEGAKCIIDATSPQRYGPFGAHAYSFLKREFLLNLLLFHYEDHGFFPEGSICVTDEWIFSNSVRTEASRWFSFKSRKKGRQYQPAWWIKIPSLQEAKSKLSSSEFEPLTH